MGDPKFIIQALALETAFILLAVLTIKKLNVVLIPSIVLGLIVIIGNTISPQHLEIMTSFSPPENAIVLIIGGYLLQFVLITASFLQFKKQKQITLDKNSLG